MIAFLLIIALLNVPAFFAPEPEPTPEPPPIVENVETRASGAVSGNKLEAAGGLVCMAIPAYIGIRLAQAGQRRKRKDIVETNSAEYALLMRRLSNMAAIMEAVKNSE